MSERHFDQSLRDLRDQLFAMANDVEKSIQAATESLLASDGSKLVLILEIEKRVNQAHVDIDDACIRLLATQQPLAADLRLIVAILKINTDLERMGDQAVNIGKNVGQYIKHPPLGQLVDLPRMSAEVRIMVRESLDAFVRSDERMARAVLRRDDLVDGLKHKIFRDVMEHLKTSPKDTEPGVTLILIARNLERIGDHATNIAEDIIFVLTGEDVRHSANKDVVQENLK